MSALRVPHHGDLPDVVDVEGQDGCQDHVREGPAAARISRAQAEVGKAHPAEGLQHHVLGVPPETRWPGRP